MAEDPNRESADSPFAEMLARLADQEQSGQPVARGEISERVDSLLAALRDAVLGAWPAVEDMRQLPPEEFAALSRQLSVFIERLSTLRAELLMGRGPRL